MGMGSFDLEYWLHVVCTAAVAASVVASAAESAPVAGSPVRSKARLVSVVVVIA